MTSLRDVVDVSQVNLGACDACHPEDPTVGLTDVNKTYHHMITSINEGEVQFSGQITLDDLGQ